MCIGVVQFVQPGLEVRAAARHDACIDLGDGPLLDRGILLLDDGGNAPAVISQDTPVAGGIRKLRGHQCKVIFIGHRDKARESRGTNQRHVAIKDQDGILRCEVRKHLLHGVSRTELLGLLHPGHGQVGQRVPDLFAAMADDAVDGLRLQRRGCAADVFEKGKPGECVEHLGTRRAHALALPGRKDDDA